MTELKLIDRFFFASLVPAGLLSFLPPPASEKARGLRALARPSFNGLRGRGPAGVVPFLLDWGRRRAKAPLSRPQERTK